MLNEFSTNESPTQSPSNNIKEIEKKDNKNNFSIFPSFNANFFKNQIFSQKSIKNEKIGKILKQKIKKRVFKKIIKKKISNNSLLLDFDFILKEFFQNKNLNNFPPIKKEEKSQFPEIPNKQILGKKRKIINENNKMLLNGKEKSKK